MSPIFFCAFIVVFSLFLISMLIAIIMAHYYEYEEQQIMMTYSLAGTQQNFLQLMFQFVKKAAAPEEQRASQWALVKCWHSAWKRLEAWILTEEVKDTLIEEEIMLLRAQLSSKYKKPKYNKNEVHYYLKPYLKTAES